MTNSLSEQQRIKYNWRERAFVGMLRAFLHHPVMVDLLKVSNLLYPASSNEWFDHVHLEFTLPRLDAQFDNLRLVQLSDLHYGTWINRTRLEQAVQAVNNWGPDLVVITGDFVTHRPGKYMPELTAGLSPIIAPQGKLAILGNHDHWTDPKLVRKMLREAGFSILDNIVHTIHAGDSLLHIAGIDDFMTGHDRLDIVLEQLPAEGCAILLAHEPDFADASALCGRFDLQLSGHAHGGQIKLPVVGTPLLPWYGRKYPSGLYQVNGMTQYTSRGLGTSEIQVRFRVRPEVTFITLRSSSSSTTSSDK